MPAGFDIFEKADLNRTETIAFSGIADVTITNRDDDRTMTVSVDRLLRGREDS